MSQPGKQSDEHLSEELVAYLDGELSADESESVESRIQSDEHARGELQKFDRVWNALDELPRATVDDHFTRTTIEMAAIEAKKELAHETAMLPVRRRNRWLKTAGMIAAAAVAGFVALLVLTPNPNRELYTNLPVILELDAYSEVRDIEFLQLLDSEAGDWLLNEWGTEVEQDADELATVTSASYAERKEFVDGLSEDERADLASKHRRYQSFMPEMRDELNRRHSTLAADPEADRLQQLLLAYYAWVSQQDEMQQARLRMMDAPERIAQVQEMHREADRERRWRLSPSNAAALRRAMDEMADDPKIRQLHLGLVESLPDVENLPEGVPRDREEWVRRYKKFKEKLPKMSPQLSIRMVMFVAPFRPPEFQTEAFAAYRDEIEGRLIDALDEKSAKELPSEERRRAFFLSGWLAQASAQDSNPDQATLEEFFYSDALTNEERQALLALPSDQMLNAIEMRYAREFTDEVNVDGELREWMREFGGGRGPGRWGYGRRSGDRHDKDRRGEDRRGEDRRGGPPGEERPGGQRPGGERRGPGGPPEGREGPPPGGPEFGPPPPRPDGPMP